MEINLECLAYHRECIPGGGSPSISDIFGIAIGITIGCAVGVRYNCRSGSCDLFEKASWLMNHEAMQELCDGKPFEPFEIRLTNGEKYRSDIRKWPC